MTKRCPIMSKQNESHSKIYCFENECAFWDEEREQCCILTQALAAEGKAPVTPVIMQPAVTTTPAVVPNGTGDWVDPNPYRINCSEKYEEDQVVFSALHNALKEEYKL